MDHDRRGQHRDGTRAWAGIGHGKIDTGRDVRRRRTGVRLEQGACRADLVQPQHARRQPLPRRHRDLVHLCRRRRIRRRHESLDAGRCECARKAASSGGGAVESAGQGNRGEIRRAVARTHEAPGNLRRTRITGSDHQTIHGAGAQTARALDAAHETNLADGARPICREWQLGVRHRRSRAGDALCRVAAVPGARRQARQLRLREDQRHARRPRRRGGRPGRAAARAQEARTLGQHEGAKRHRGDCRALLAGAQGAGGAARDLGLRSRRAVENDPADL